MKNIRKKIREICESGETVLWFSGGKDSRLLLELMIAEKLQFSIFCFDDGWTREQRKVVDDTIKTHNLKVYSYLPAHAHLFGNGEEIALASHYAVGKRGETIPVLRDVVHDASRCAVTDLTMEFGDSKPPVFFENHILGSKRREKHFAFAGRDTVTSPEFEVGGARFFCPLYFYADTDVWKELSKIGILNPNMPESRDGGNIPVCSLCLRGETVCPKTNEPIAALAWNPQKNLAEWRDLVGVR